ncbi:ribosome-associated ATPase/putative transporter RbbA [Roseovarius gahaiensis]|uniref:Ribosome-associated ATPase/putative transporter RbbA n=1 Tax=Roseovarius gahaiensis TaxID=2716691 RepID=A0A967EH43_9RHOB|nr:ribosome-associated ATPase/putative transporter RbbA [Roseovarius gahaiensis]NHQ75410.1 ribosome-associated ATPase/putative transporter RbbA [Roseovarius gahaiensis]
MSTEPITVDMADISHRYGATTALDDVSLRFAQGDMVGLIGPDGVGKSTLLGLMAGVRRIQQGRVKVLGGDMANPTHRAASYPRIAYMPQGLGRNLYPTLSVYENVDFFGRLFGQGPSEREDRIRELLESTGLAPFAARPADNLSGGMKQKLSLCCALIHDPDLLILDEPTTGVDPLSRKQFWQLIDRIRARSDGMTMAIATAYMSEAERFDHVVAMDEGRVLAKGTPQDLRAEAGADTLEEAFIAFLPEEKREGHGSVHLPPRDQTEDRAAIKAEGLTKRFGDFTAVDNVSFEIGKGEIFGFLGSNGCGKTTTMKMLTGLLDPTEGHAQLFGKSVDSSDLKTRRRVGYMSQSFSLYAELSVRQNLVLHAQLFQLSAARQRARVRELLDRFELEDIADSRPGNLPLGVRQRLQLAVAVLHKPEMLILDEPTSGVDPVVRDRFWEMLIALSREDGVTIFISTHFMNEAERCDRISLMHAGQVLAVEEPDALRRERGADSLEEAFIEYLEEAADDQTATKAPAPDRQQHRAKGRRGLISSARIWAFARREGIELGRDPIRLTFALLGPVILMIAVGFGISFDVENLSYATVDHDRSAESRALGRQFSSSRYFQESAELRSAAEMAVLLRSGDVALALVIPPDFGRDLLAGERPEVALWLDGSNTVRAESARRYAEATFTGFLAEMSQTETGQRPGLYPATIEPRFRYNQSFDSAYAIPPGVLMMMLIMIPTMMTALGVVREKEMGSITNLYAAPVRKLEFLIGKQMPYIGVAMISFVILVGMLLSVFGLRIEGSLLALVTGALLYTGAATAFGLVISTFVRSQIAAIFGSAIIVIIPTVNFSGMLYPVSTLDGVARMIGEAFPALYFQRISTGVFNKGLGLGDLYLNHLILAGFCGLFLMLASVLLQKQEA